MNKFAIILGEPNSINIEILAKSIARRKNCLIIGNIDLIKAQLKILKKNIKIINYNHLNKLNKTKNELLVYDVPLSFKNPFNVSAKNSKVYINKSFVIANKLSIEKKIKGFINCPIDKKVFFGHKAIGITEYLAKKNNCLGSEAMLIYNPKLSVAPITTHISINNIKRNIKKSSVRRKIIIINTFYKKYFGKKPRIGVLGLNPHNNELRKHSEEVKIIIPTINKLKSKINVKGPFPADTIFLKENRKKFDVIVGMYHDQVLAPFKTIFGFDAINITLGLPYIRISPDHGIAADKKKLNLSKPDSLNKCISFFSKL